MRVCVPVCASVCVCVVLYGARVEKRRERQRWRAYNTALAGCLFFMWLLNFLQSNRIFFLFFLSSLPVYRAWNIHIYIKREEEQKNGKMEDGDGEKIALHFCYFFLFVRVVPVLLLFIFFFVLFCFIVFSLHEWKNNKQNNIVVSSNCFECNCFSSIFKTEN